MAHWISSKLKAAETLLQHIDQQAAESLRKNEKQTSDDQLVVETSPKTPETKSLLKDQLKKKAAENVGGQTPIPSEKRNLNIISKSNNDVNRNDEARRTLNLTSKSNVSEGLTDSDWTELLSVPDKKGTSGGGSVAQSSNQVSAIRALKKKGKKVGNYGQGGIPSAEYGRSEKVRNGGASKSSRKSNVGSGSSNSVGSDVKATSVDATPRTSSEGEPDQRDMSTVNMGKLEGLNDIVDGEKLQPSDDSESYKMSTSLAKKLDKKVGLNDGGRLKKAVSGSSRSTNGSRTPGSKKVSSLPSEEESNSETDSTSSSGSESEREKEERRKRRQQILAERAAAKAIQAIKERENLVARLEGEKQSLEKILEERTKQQVQEASELQSTMMETMEAAELEKQKHNNTRMEILAQLAKLESVNADLTRALANAQKNLEVEADLVAELRQQIQMKEATHEELRRKISSTHQNGDKLRASKGVEFEMEMLEAEYSYVADKVERMQEQAKNLETSIEKAQREIENPSEIEIELKLRLSQLTDHLIQKQAQVETLSSEKAMLLFKIEGVSRLLDESSAGNSSRDGLEPGAFPLPNSNFSHLLKDRMQSGQQHLGSLVRQLDSLFSTGAVFLRRNSTARIWAIVYLACLHLWVMYILMSHSPVSDDTRSGAVVSLENINNTATGGAV